SIIDTWCHDTPALRHLPMPIQHFLEHGWPFNVDVIDRFLDMARRWEEDDAPDVWPLWGLPKYMVDGFRRSREHPGGRGNGRSQRPGLTREQPYIAIDLTRSNAPMLFVPPQTTQAHPLLKVHYAWVGSHDCIEEAYAPHVTPSEGHFLTDPCERP